MTIKNWISIKCNCEYTFDFMLPNSITTWLYPDMVQTLVDGGYYETYCPECGMKIIIDGELMINTPKGIVLIRSGPLEKLIPLLKQLEIVDEKGIPFSSNEISSKLTHNMKNLDENPMLKQQYENNPMEMIEKMRKDAEEKNKKKSRKKRFGLF